MKTIRLILAAALCACALLVTGCFTKPDFAATKLKVTNPLGKSIEITLPKDLDATELDVSADPATGTYHLKAKTLKTDASTVIESAATAQADAIGKLADTLKIIVPLVSPARQ